ncbi:MAG TPA: hypothetical protein VHY33_03570 [Thermoanaerobaculia bacterium]|jgi:hypothetical protein|nr:hypothetical protein [Thermoanaerobaculia bacterium]
MLTYRLRVAVLCVLLTGGTILSSLPSCGRSVTPSGPTCCKNEATCPMHQKHASFGFNVCNGDSAVSSAVTTAHRAVLQTAVCIDDAPHCDRVFATTTILLPSVSVAPFTPPPRLG